MFDAKIEVANCIGANHHALQSDVADGAAAPALPARATEDATAISVRAAFLNHQYGDLPAAELVSVVMREAFRGRIALVSSFGTESAVLLDLVAKVEPATPVLFLDTGKLFDATLRYRDALAARLGLTDIRVLHPNAWSLDAEDPDGTLWGVDADRCCFVRKVVPLARGLENFDAWITGRKRFQGGERGQLSAIEADAAGKIKINPLARWTPAEIAAYFVSHDLPRHELEAAGYQSIGCAPCTDRVNAWEGPRAGRWRHAQKTECGIHGRSFKQDDRR